MDVVVGEHIDVKGYHTEHYTHSLQYFVADTVSKKKPEFQRIQFDQPIRLVLASVWASLPIHNKMT